ncbi:hypothetical protein NYQ10_03145 [Flavobacterium johnsoniae]|uniref:hypothetical protein n=1 Tax=Flavobacterium johnsoniae TaxID=986 RepID=UPI0025AF7AF0|nr:hypothetical protein [Flavobacterium johnsoniae]WJS95452.1 hypothetical protein NYQ10_03145 [Flavobacterium johnsoniae]
MIKSYKTILIVQFFVLIVVVFLFYNLQYGIDFVVISKIPLLLIGFSLFLILGISILIQRLIIVIINSDSSENLKNGEDKFWSNCFFANVIFSAIVFIFSLVCVILNLKIGIKGFDGFGIRFSVFLGIAFTASFIVGLLLKIKKSVNEVSPLLGGLMIFLSLLIFGVSLFIGLNNLLKLQYSAEVVDSLNTIPEVEEATVMRTDTAYAVVDSFAIDSLTIRQELDKVRDYEDDYYGIKDFSYPEIEKEIDSKGIFNDDNWHETQGFLRVFLSDFLKLKKAQSFMEIRRSIQMGLHSNNFYGILDKIKMVRYNSRNLEDTFQNYRPLIYAFISNKVYYDSNLNLLVDALIKSYDDIDALDPNMKVLENIYDSMIPSGKHPMLYYRKIQPYVSPAVLQLIKKNADRNGENLYSTQLTTVWIYGFWARREKERNIRAVHKILLEIKEHYDVKEND